jgi:sugar phosphate isomerase/epimerase
VAQRTRGADSVVIVGLDTYTLSGLGLGPYETLAFARAHGLRGLQLGSAASVSPSLDHGALREFRREAEGQGLRVELSLPQVNPHRLRHDRAVLAAGEGDVRRGLGRYVEAAHAAGGRELHSSIGHLGDRVPGPGQSVVRADGGGELVRERWGAARLDASLSWDEQVRDTIAFLRGFRPQLRELGCRVNLETHADATTFELVRVVEELGDDVQGITLDVANTMNQLEDPVAAAHRAAPYVHNTHTKDGLLFFGDAGLVWQPRACGDGVVPLDAVLPLLAEHEPDLMLAIEDHKWIYELPIYDPAFLACHPDLTPVELAALVRLAQLGQGRVDRGETTEPYASERVPWAEQQVPRIEAARDHLEQLLARAGLARAPAA